MPFIFLYLAFVKEPFYFKAFYLIGIAFDKYGKKVGWKGSCKQVFNRGWYRLQLGHKEDWVNLPIR